MRKSYPSDISKEQFELILPDFVIEDTMKKYIKTETSPQKKISKSKIG